MLQMMSLFKTCICS